MGDLGQRPLPSQSDLDWLSVNGVWTQEQEATQRNGGTREAEAGLCDLTLKVGGALEPASEERRFWLGLSFMVGGEGQISPGSGNSSGGLRYSSSEVMGLLNGDVDPPGGETVAHRGMSGEEGGQRD